MIKTETIIIDGQELVRTYSDRGMRIMQETGNMYDEAVDIPDSGHTYVETDEPFSEELTDHEALNFLLGRDNDETI